MTFLYQLTRCDYPQSANLVLRKSANTYFSQRTFKISLSKVQGMTSLGKHLFSKRCAGSSGQGLRRSISISYVKLRKFRENLNQGARQQVSNPSLLSLRATLTADLFSHFTYLVHRFKIQNFPHKTYCTGY